MTVAGAVSLALALLFVATLRLAFPRVGPAPSLAIEATPERVARGAYLANHVTVCIDCHSVRDWSRFSGPIVAGTEGRGGEVFDRRFRMPGTFYARNITPARLADWTDGELVRLVTTGLTKDDEPIFPVMPYRAYRLPRSG